MGRVKAVISPTQEARVKVVKNKIIATVDGIVWRTVSMDSIPSAPPEKPLESLRKAVMYAKEAVIPDTGGHQVREYRRKLGFGNKAKGDIRAIHYTKKGNNQMKNDVQEFRQSSEVLTAAHPKISALRRISLINKFNAFGSVTKDMSKGEKEYLDFYNNMSVEEKENEILHLNNVLSKD